MAQGICSIDGCGKALDCHGYCGMHYMRWKRYADPLFQATRIRPSCSIAGCDRPHKARGLCNMHYQRLQNNGDPLIVHRDAAMPPDCKICGGPTHALGLCPKCYVGKRRKEGTGSPCTVDDCDRPAYLRGWCEMHYHRWRAHDDPSIRLTAFGSLADRMDFYFRSGPHAECWPWAGYTDVGYAVLKFIDGNVRPQRIIYEIACGPIPAGYEVDHLCHNRSRTCEGGEDCPHRRCLNPAHLQAVPGWLNTKRSRLRANVQR